MPGLWEEAYIYHLINTLPPLSPDFFSLIRPVDWDIPHFGFEIHLIEQKEEAAVSLVLK